MKKHFFFKTLVLSTALLITVAGCSGGGTTSSSIQNSSTQSVSASSDSNAGTEAGETYILKISTVLSDTSPNVAALNEFERHLEELTDGRIDVQVYPGGVLVSSDEMNAEWAISGGLEIAVSPPFALGKVANAPEMEIFDYPYMFKTNEVCQEYVKTDVIKQVEERIEANHDVKIMGYYDISWLDIGNRTRPLVNVPGDGSGMKVRSPMGTIWVDTLESLGPSPVPIAFGEIFSALQQGTLDGVLTTASNMMNSRFYEVIDYITFSDHILSAYVIMVNGTFYNSLTPDLQAHLETALEAFRLNALTLYQEERAELPDRFRELGLEVYELTDDDYELWKAAVQPAVEKNKDKLGDGFYEASIKEIEAIEARLGL